jgi:Holliday junction resolvase
VIRLYVDHDSAERALVSELRRRGMDVLTSIEAGNARASDEEQLAFATGLAG